MDNGSNFASAEFWDIYNEMGIQVSYASVAHPQTNDQVKKFNGIVCSCLKNRILQPLQREVGVWHKKLPSIQWSLRTTPNMPTQYTPFFMVHGEEVGLPSDVRFNAPWIIAYNEAASSVVLEDGVNILDEACDIALA
jgi:hypothetical protein